MTAGPGPREPPKPRTRAEVKILRELLSGRPIEIGEQASGSEAPDASSIAAPDDAPKRMRVRASFLRRVLLGEAGPLHDKGLCLVGALIEGDGSGGGGSSGGLDLEECRLSRNLSLYACRFAEPIVLRDAAVPTLNLSNSHLPGLEGDRLTSRGSIFIRGAVWARAREIRWYLWLHIVAGWAVSLLAIAGFSGLVKSD